MQIAGGEADRVLTLTDFAPAAALGVRTSMTAGAAFRLDVIGEYAQRAAEGTFSIPVACTYPLDEWREAMELSLSGRARGKLVLLVP